MSHACRKEFHGGQIKMKQVSWETLSTRLLLKIFYIKSHNFGVFVFNNKAFMAKSTDTVYSMHLSLNGLMFAIFTPPHWECSDSSCKVGGKTERQTDDQRIGKIVMILY